MSVTWLTLKSQLHAYLSQVTLEQKLKEKMTYLQNLMEGGIRDVQDASQLKKWIDQMFHKGHEIIVLLEITSNISVSFIYQYQELSVIDVVENITDKIESMNVTYRMVNIEELKRKFVFDEPESVLDGFQHARELRVSSLLQELGSMGDENEQVFHMEI
jgi:hypothetical protein